MLRIPLLSLGLLATLLLPRPALAVKSAEIFTPKAYGYGRFEARLRFAAGDGVISSFFLWKEGSEQPGTFWNELDFEKLGADCHLETNAIFGNPASNNTKRHTATDLCNSFHTYGYEWTADSIAWFLDGVEIRREGGAIAAAFAQNAASGMRIHFNIWPGDASFGGNFSPSILPVHQFVDWVQYSPYANGAFTLEWREDFGGAALGSNWLTGDWGSPKNLSTHDPRNVNLLGNTVVLSLTADNAVGSMGANPGPLGGAGGAGAGGSPNGTGGSAGAAGNPSTAGATSSGGASSVAGAAGNAGAAGMLGTGGSGASSGTTGGAPSASGGTPGTAGSANPGGGSPNAGTGGAATPGAGTAGANTSGANTAGNPSTAQGGAAASGGQPPAGPGPAPAIPTEGCGCSFRSERPSAMLGLLGFLALAAVRRRSRRSQATPRS